MTNTTLNKWLKRLKQPKALTKVEIQALNKNANSIRFLRDDAERETNAQTLLNQVTYSACEFKITKEQSQYGIEYLLNRYFKKNGEQRTKTHSVLGDYEVTILRNFKKFTFVGLYEETTEYGMRFYHIVYRVHSKQGKTFDYIPMHWGEIKVVAL